jgi:hypothetical protein
MVLSPQVPLVRILSSHLDEGTVGGGAQFHAEAEEEEEGEVIMKITIAQFQVAVDLQI